MYSDEPGWHGTQTFDPEAGGASTPATSGAPAITRGTRIDRYLVEERIGEGGMGVVYAAIDLDLDRRVAIKIVRGAWHGQLGERHARQLAEARAMARLDHPNVVRVFEVGAGTIGDREHAFIAMELVDGASLTAWSAGRSWRERLDALVAAGRGLAAAHQAGLTHRDVKPDNVLVDRSGRARIGDFGLATTAPEASEACGRHVAPGTAGRLTRTGAVMGTPAYMAPEQHRGEAADARTDQFSFCVTAWSVMYEQHPFDLDDMPAAALAGVVRTPPRHQIPAWLEPLLRTGLAVDTDRRHPSMTALLDAIERRLRPRRRWRWLAVAAIASTTLLASSLWLADGEARSAVPAARCPAPELPDLHVSATAAAGGNGSAACPFRTVTAALAVNTPVRTIHIGPGRYDASHGETLPLVVRGATTLRGAGVDVTVIAGLGLFDPRPDRVAFSRFPLRATLVIGDDAADVALTDLSVDGAQRIAAGGSAGILCTRGNLHAFDGAMPAPNTRLERVGIGNGYETGLVVTGGISPGLTGCNLALDSGLVHDTTVGIWQMGCGLPHAAAPTALAVSDSAFRSLRGAPPPILDGRSGLGVLVWDCARRTRIEDSEFSDSEHGVYLVRHRVPQDGAARALEAAPAVIAGNVFAELGRVGAFLEQAVDVELRRNTFHGIPAAVQVLATTHEPPRVRARDNVFFGNQVAVDISARSALPAATAIDFGRAGDPGGNVFNCNAVGNADAAHATIAVRAPASGNASVMFEGNRWDHTPVRIARKHTGGRAEITLPRADRSIGVELATTTGEECATR